MGLGPYVVMAWFGILLASAVIAGVHLVRKRANGVWQALSAILGGLLSWALVSAYIGAFEVTNYTTSKAFFISLGIGLTGLALVIASCPKRKQKNSQVAARGV